MELRRTNTNFWNFIPLSNLDWDGLLPGAVVVAEAKYYFLEARGYFHRGFQRLSVFQLGIYISVIHSLACGRSVFFWRLLPPRPAGAVQVPGPLCEQRHGPDRGG